MSSPMAGQLSNIMIVNLPTSLITGKKCYNHGHGGTQHMWWCLCEPLPFFWGLFGKPKTVRTISEARDEQRRLIKQVETSRPTPPAIKQIMLLPLMMILCNILQSVIQ